MIANLQAEESEESRCLDLVARCAPKFMVTGGGPLMQERREQSQVNRMNDAQRNEVRRMGAMGAYTATEIARAVGSTRSAVYKVLVRSGIKIPDGRAKNRKVSA